jgi:hypothetical protein
MADLWTHPHVLHATAALWSLRRSWALLRTAAQDHADADGYSLPSAWHPGSRSSGAGDGFATAVLTATSTSSHYTRLTEQVTEQAAQARWLVVSALRDRAHTGPSLAVVAAGLPHVDPATAGDISRHLGQADTAIRRTLRIQPDHWPLPGNPPCPLCGVRLLRVQVSPSDSADWTVVCTAGCRCRGDRCPCGMAITAQGVRHIWGARSPLVVEALARLPRRRVRHR